MISVSIPLHVKATSNLREHWAPRAERAAMHRAAAKLALGRRKRPTGRIVVTLTRVSPKELDDDNWVGAAKSLRDGVADWLGIDDRDKRVAWHYQQEKGESAVRIELEEAPQ